MRLKKEAPVSGKEERRGLKGHKVLSRKPEKHRDRVPKTTLQFNTFLRIQTSRDVACIAPTYYLRAFFTAYARSIQYALALNRRHHLP